MKSRKGKWIRKAIKVRWFCGNCHQKGIADFSYNKNSPQPTTPEIAHAIEVTCHTDCKEPIIKMYLHYENTKAVH